MEKDSVYDLYAAQEKNKIDSLRTTNQVLLPVVLPDVPADEYRLYPAHGLGAHKIAAGYTSLALRLSTSKNVILDGFGGLYWDRIKGGLTLAFEKMGLKVKWHPINEALKTAHEIDEITAPFLGGPDSVWGTKTNLDLLDFFSASQLLAIRPDERFALNIVYGTGAALSKLEEATVVYFDLPKNEIQYRMRSGHVFNLGKAEGDTAANMYKRCYFVDWVVLNTHKKSLLNAIDIIADAQALDTVTWAAASDIYTGLDQLARSVFRVRPWFEPGVWGGQWLKEQIPSISQDEINYAWSFELIVPENGLLFESSSLLLEISFDFLMFRHTEQVLGKHSARFGFEFPIRFDFLDTFDGEPLSIQCHPSLAYIQENFGETITQDETYYMMDCKDDANVYLGFQQDINENEFKEVLEDSQVNAVPVAIEKYVQVHPAKKHELFLIPNGTVHSAGKNNLVLEISATPYIFTFKMYDWVRLGLDGKPRPINIDHAFKNLNFERKGAKVKTELIARAHLIGKGTDWNLYHLPTHRDHFYDIHRIEFETQVSMDTANVCHVLMLVEGTALRIRLQNGMVADFNYAETFVVPAAAGSYTLINAGSVRAKVIKAFIKEEQ